MQKSKLEDNSLYSIKWEGDDNPILINDERFSPAGVLAPKEEKLRVEIDKIIAEIEVSE